MPDHEVRLSTSNLVVKGINLEFQIKIDGLILGALAVSEGGLEWTPKRGRSRIPIGWREFANWAEGED